jgi:hypothetical protein
MTTPCSWWPSSRFPYAKNLVTRRLLLILALLAIGCEGRSGGSKNTAPPPADFFLINSSPGPVEATIHLSSDYILESGLAKRNEILWLSRKTSASPEAVELTLGIQLHDQTCDSWLTLKYPFERFPTGLHYVRESCNDSSIREVPDAQRPPRDLMRSKEHR